jgi:hypothetical protein
MDEGDLINSSLAMTQRRDELIPLPQKYRGPIVLKIRIFSL